MIAFRILWLGFGLLVLDTGLSARQIQQPAPRPNILLVIVDDLGPRDPGCYGGDVVETPRIDRLAAEGRRFTRAYAGCTVCAPSRSVLMTGLHMGRTSVRLNTGGVPLVDEDLSLAELLRFGGYQTAGFGKWGLGDLGTTGAPERQGFDLFHGYYHQVHAHDYWPAYLIRNGSKELNEPRERHSAQGYAHYRNVAETKAFLRRAAESSEPFFCLAAWCPPHGQYQLPLSDPAWTLYKDRPWPERARKCAAMINMIDRHLGELLDLLEELGLARDTLVLFMSDNGAAEHPDFQKYLKSSGELRGWKRKLYEGGIRTPFIARWPERIEAGSTSDSVISFQDVLPTLAELAQLQDRVPEAVTGVSFLPALFGDWVPPADHHHYWEWHRYHWGRRELVPGGLMQALRQGRWKLVRHDLSSDWELYDLPRDPSESRDLAAQHPTKVAQLAGLIATARKPMRVQTEPPHPKGQAFN